MDKTIVHTNYAKNFIHREFLYIYENTEIKTNPFIEVGVDREFLSKIINIKNPLEGYPCIYKASFMEFIFAHIAAIVETKRHEEEINTIFNKRIYEIDDNLIKEHAKFYKYIQPGQDVNLALKLSLSILRDIDSKTLYGGEIEVIDTSMSAMYKGELHLDRFINKCRPDIQKLLKKMLRISKKTSTQSPYHLLEYHVLETLTNITTKCSFKVHSASLISLFTFVLPGVLDSLAKTDEIKDINETIKETFDNREYIDITTSPFALFEYAKNASNYAARINKNYDLSSSGIDGIEGLLGGLLISSYVPSGQGRSDYQFIIYLLMNHLYSNINKELRALMDEEAIIQAKKRILMSYRLASRFKFEGKEKHNFATVMNALLYMCEDLEMAFKKNTENVVTTILDLKKFQESTIKQLNETFLVNSKLEDELLEYKEKERLKESKLRNKLEKEIFTKIKESNREEISAYKKQILTLEKELDKLKSNIEDELMITVDEAVNNGEIEIYNLGALRAVFVGDYNFNETLFKTIFKEFTKIVGHNPSTNNPAEVIGKADILIFQYGHMLHISEKFEKEAKEKGITIVYTNSVNPTIILGEIFAELYKSR